MAKTAPLSTPRPMTPFLVCFHGRFFLSVLLALSLGVHLGAALPSPDLMKGEVETSGDALMTVEGREMVSLKLSEPSGRAVVTFHYKDSPLDLSGFRDISFSVKNGTSAELDVLLGARSDLQEAWRASTSGRFLVRSGEETEMSALLPRKDLPSDHPHVKSMGNLFAFPWGHHRHWRAIDPAAILRASVQIDWRNAEPGQVIEIGAPRGTSECRVEPELLETLDFPMVDEFGQLRWSDWPSKVANAKELREDGREDLALAAEVTNPGPGRSRYGGLRGGPDLKATGFFRVEKVNGKWWFVDPEGNLFWSLGVNSLGASVTTRVEGREHLFPEIWRSQPSIGPYDENLKLKYGDEGWREKNLKVSLSRMFAWGLNTVGAWSRPDFAESQRMPYTLIIHTDMQGLGSVAKIPDPYSKAFLNSVDNYVRSSAEEHAKSPWLVGVFIDNELDWQGDNKLAKEVMRSGAGTPARLALVEFLEKRYGNVAALNQAWGTNFGQFSAIKPGEEGSGNKAYEQDLDDFLGLFAEQYFSVCRAAMDKYFPNHLYLGCRFHVFNPVITAAASRHSDVISVNIYQHNFEGFTMETEEDRPWLISEFHFGMRDHGNLGVGLTWAADARNQADLVEAYLSDALRHPHFVGAHWFAWNDQGVTGRGDGENFGVGLVTVVDRPVETLTGAMRRVSDELQAFRSGDFPHRIGGDAGSRPVSPGAGGITGSESGGAVPRNPEAAP